MTLKDIGREGMDSIQLAQSSEVETLGSIRAGEYKQLRNYNNLKVGLLCGVIGRIVSECVCR
jgi:hypothetical protein